MFFMIEHIEHEVRYMNIRLLLLEGILAVVPEYLPDFGNATTVYTRKATYLDAPLPRTIFRNIAAHYGIDLRTSRAPLAERFHIVKNVPYVFDSDNIFFAVRTRLPVAKNDGASSYVNAAAIVGVSGDTITFDTDETLTVLESQRSVETSLARALQIRLELVRRQQRDAQMQGRNLL